MEAFDFGICNETTANLGGGWTWGGDDQTQLKYHINLFLKERRKKKSTLLNKSYSSKCVAWWRMDWKPVIRYIYTQRRKFWLSNNHWIFILAPAFWLHTYVFLVFCVLGFWTIACVLSNDHINILGGNYRLNIPCLWWKCFGLWIFA